LDRAKESGKNMFTEGTTETIPKVTLKYRAEEKEVVL
jgi:hypothetical protein